MSESVKHFARSVSNIHRPGMERDIYIFSTPRSGSTWLMDLIWTQPSFKYCNEPLNLRNERVRQYSGFSDWYELYNHGRQDKLIDYFSRLKNGRLRFLNPNPTRRYYRPVTSRIVFKVINGGEADINLFGDVLQGQIVFLVRHPIPTTFSRKVHPRLEVFLQSDYADHFSNTQLERSQHILRKGDHFERGILSWCLQNAVPLTSRTSDWIVLTYEQLVVDPDPAIRTLSERLGLPKPERMAGQMEVASKVSIQSDDKTREFFSGGDSDDRRWLIEKWRNVVSEEQLAFTQRLLDTFNIDIYQAEAILPGELFVLQ